MQDDGTDLRYVAVYGSLRQVIFDPHAPSMEGRARYVGPCTLMGWLLDHATYPGFFPDPENGGPVAADLLEVIDADSFFTAFDDWEDYFPDDPDGSEYTRRVVDLHAPEGRAWVYVSNRSPSDPVISHGDWARVVQERQAETG